MFVFSCLTQELRQVYSLWLFDGSADVHLYLWMFFIRCTLQRWLLILQANGIGRDFLDDDSVYIFDMYNRNIYPQDGYAKSMLVVGCMCCSLWELKKKLWTMFIGEDTFNALKRTRQTEVHLACKKNLSAVMLVVVIWLQLCHHHRRHLQQMSRITQAVKTSIVFLGEELISLRCRLAVHTAKLVQWLAWLVCPLNLEWPFVFLAVSAAVTARKNKWSFDV